MISRPLLTILALFCLPAVVQAAGEAGYYRFPAIHGDSVVFTSEGDLWKVGIGGGVARALTSNPGMETHAAISPDGKTIAFSAGYEGPTEVYTMPIDGGLPTRLTYEGANATVVGWTPDGRVLYATGVRSTLPDDQLATVDPRTAAITLIPLRQASEGVYDPTGTTLYFTRLPFQGSHTRRYQGGTAQNLWKYAANAKEAVPLTHSWAGTSKAPMWWKDRIYFASDRDGSMNLWSIDTNGGALKQVTHHVGWDIQSPSLDAGRIVYQMGADLWLYDIATGKDSKLDITLSSDLDQTREKWIKNPLSYLTGTSLAPDGSRVALTARGQVFVAPVKQGRFVEVTRKPGVRYRQAVFLPDGKSLLALSDESGEAEWWRLPANGVGTPERLTIDGHVLRTSGTVSPDGKMLAYTDKAQELWLLDIATKKPTRIAVGMDGDISDLTWSPDGQWLAYTLPTPTFSRIMVYGLRDGKTIPLTTDRYDSYSPAWSPDGKWLYFLSDRHLQSLVDAPWGPRQPEPFFDHQTQIYQLALTKGLRSPFQPADELQTPETAAKSPEPKPAGTVVKVMIDADGIQGRLRQVPAPPGNYGALTAGPTRLYWVAQERGPGHKPALMTVDISNMDIAVKTLVDGIDGYELSPDGKHLLVNRANALFVLDGGASAPASLDNKNVDLGGWTFSIDPREEWREMFAEAWRLERDYFYDRHLHGVDWLATQKQYQPLVARVRDRDELSDLLGQMVSELSALHTFVFGGDKREGEDHIYPASLGAVWSRDMAHTGYRIDRIYAGDPDDPQSLSPLSQPGVDVAVGDVIQSINGVGTLSVRDPAILLRNLTGKQVLLKVWEAATNKVRDCVAVPISPGAFFNLRYDDWELSRRQEVETKGKGDIGYVHLRAMGSGDIARWARDFYPVFNRQGLIIDVRHNNGGNIDSWVLEKLLRRAWFYWQPRVGNSTWNMPWAFRGHVVVICDENTASDGEAFTEGFRRLGLGKVIGTRTWGGEIWLSMDNTLVDNGIASAAELGVYGPEGKWLIEGHGVDPDIIVDNLPVAAARGEDAQLQAAIDTLQGEIRAHPIPNIPAPAYPDKSGRPKRP
jgi:tricorn protease